MYTNSAANLSRKNSMLVVRSNARAVTRKILNGELSSKPQLSMYPAKMWK